MITSQYQVKHILWCSYAYYNASMRKWKGEAQKELYFILSVTKFQLQSRQNITDEVLN